MKKIIVTLIGIFMILCLVGCSNQNKNTKDNKTDISSDETENKNGNLNNSESITIYFSRTNNTEKIANYIIEITGSDKYEIEAKIPYTDDDIKYYTNCRADKEQNDPTARPEIAGDKIDLSKYSIIYLGYPIWHGDAPKIMYTFVEGYDLNGKTIFPFCTSGSSPVGLSAINLSKLTNQGTWKDGKRFSSTVTKDEVQTWLDSLGIKKQEEKLVMKIDGIKVDVSWENNDSVKELFEYAKEGLNINMNIYGGFEQVGLLGKDITSNDVRISTNPGDIVLYNSNSIVVFFGTNT